MTAASIGIAGLRLGDIVNAERFDHSDPLSIKVVSGKVAGGGAAYILKGEIQSPEPPADLPLLVAIKVILTVCPDDVNRERIRRELAAVERAQHPYILPFIGSLITDGYTILVSAFMKHGHMLEYILANPAVSKGLLVIRIAEMEASLTSLEIFHVADAVKYLHEALGLVHGDLKCQNVLISADGDALLADFGLSTTVGESLGDEATATAIRKSNTRRFAAPELFLDGAKSPSGRIRSKTTQTDVFAFGMFIIQAFTNADPWPDLNEYAIWHKLNNKKPYPRPDNSAGIGLDDRWWKLCKACFRFEPKDRPTMSEIHSQLKTILGSTQDISMVNHDTLASVFGVPEYEGLKEIDDHLKLILVGVHRGLTNLSDRSWGGITQVLSQRPFLQARNVSEINRSRSHHIARKDWFKSTAYYNDVISGVRGWLKELIEDPDVIDARVEVDLNAVEEIVAHAGNIMSMLHRKEKWQTKILDIGTIRYPDISQPYVKVYRIELVARFNSRSIPGLGIDNNGFYGQYNAKSYIPNDTVTARIRSSMVEKAVREAEDLFL